MFNPSVISDRRKRAGLSQSALGNALGVHKNTVLAWEKGKQPINLEEFLRFCEVVGESPFSVISGSDGAAENVIPYQVPAPALDQALMESAMLAVLKLLEARKLTLSPERTVAGIMAVYEAAKAQGRAEVADADVTPLVRLLMA